MIQIRLEDSFISFQGLQYITFYQSIICLLSYTLFFIEITLIMIIIAYYLLLMECNQCGLRYNTHTRQPYILKCGHTICDECTDVIKKCPSCLTETQIPKLNHSLLQIVQKDQTNIDKFIKICFIGSSAVGKTSLISLLMDNQFKTQIPPTIGYDFAFIDRKIGHITVRYQLWDSAGQQRFRAISPIHYKNANVIIIVYDISENQQYNNVQYWLEQVQKHSSGKRIIILLGNKLDLIQGKMCKPLSNQVWQMVQEEKLIHLELSCKTKIGLQPLWNELEKIVKNKQFERRETKINQGIGSKLEQIKRLTKKNKYLCC